MKTRLALFITLSLPCAAERVICPASADAWVAMHRWEGPPPQRADAEKNHGKDAELPIQGRASFALLDFDVSALKGMAVEKATLRVHRHPAPHPLHTVGLSTVSGSGRWEEASVNFFRPAEGRAWSYPGSDLVDVTFAQAGSLYSYERARDAGDGWWEIDVPAAIATALATGDQYGLMLCDEKGQLQIRHVIDSRESAYPPVLIVEGKRASTNAPKVVPAFQTSQDSSPEAARRLGRTTLRPGSVILRFANTGGAVHYDVRYSTGPIDARNFDGATQVARWCVNPLAPKAGPFATANSIGREATAVVEDLRPGQSYYFAARATGSTGGTGPVTFLGVYRAYSRAFPTLPAAPAARLEGGTADSGPVRLWAFPETLKVNPVTGALLEHGNFPDPRARNTVWDAASSTVKLTGARNEFVAFQVAVESAAPLSGVDVAVSKPLFANSRLPEIFRHTGAVQLYREWFVPDRNQWYADALVPVTGPLDLPAKDNAVPGQTVQPVFVDIYVPHDAKPGLHSGELTVRAAGTERRIKIEVEVLPLTLPDKLNFVVDLNAYSQVRAGTGAHPGTPEYRNLEEGYHRVAHLHRANFDILGYDHDGGTIPDHTPPLEGEGANTKVKSWEDWDAHFGRLVSGAAFADLARPSVPVPALYLPFFENWPGDLHRSYRWDDPTVPKTVEEYQRIVDRHALEAGPIQEGFSPEYQDRYTAVVAQFAEHFRRNGWLDTKYLVYFNNKYYYKRPDMGGGRGISFWLWDEPNHRDSVLATNFLAYLTHKGLARYPDVPVVLRTDISRVEWLRDLIAGQIDLDCISQRFYQKNRYLHDDHDRFGREYWNYSSTNHPRETNVTMRAWCWRVWLNGGNGLVPWLTVRGPEAWNRAEPLTVFYTGGKFGYSEPLPSMRLKAYRRGEQDVEYLAMLAAKRGWDRDAVTNAVSKALDLSGEVRMTSEEDAGSISFGRVKDADIEQIRMRVARALMQP